MTTYELDSDLHLAKVSPIVDALGTLAWTKPVVWFHDFGIVHMTPQLQLRIGTTAPEGNAHAIKAIVAAISAVGTGIIAQETFTINSYINPTREFSSHIQLVARDNGTVEFVMGKSLSSLPEKDRKRLGSLSRAIEAWASLLTGQGIPQNSIPSAARQAQHEESGEGASGPRPVTDPDHVVVIEDHEASSPASAGADI